MTKDITLCKIIRGLSRILINYSWKQGLRLFRALRQSDIYKIIWGLSQILVFYSRNRVWYVSLALGLRHIQDLWGLSRILINYSCKQPIDCNWLNKSSQNKHNRPIEIQLSNTIQFQLNITLIFGFNCGSIEIRLRCVRLYSIMLCQSFFGIKGKRCD